MPNGGSPVVLLPGFWGDLTKREWSAIADGLGANVEIIEIHDDDDEDNKELK